MKTLITTLNSKLIHKSLALRLLYVACKDDHDIDFKEYTIKDELGIHARPAGMLVKEAKNFASECTITKDGKTKKLTQLMMLMSLGVKQGDTVTVAANGEDEDAAIETLKAVFEANQ